MRESGRRFEVLPEVFELGYSEIYMREKVARQSAMAIMKSREHVYRISVDWIGNQGLGTSGYRSYSRDHLIRAGDKPPIPASSDPAFLGDSRRWNPEELLVASVSACHKLWYLSLCAEAGVVVVGYVDNAEGTMLETDRGRFTKIVLRPHVTLKSEDHLALATHLHEEAHAQCFIANSVNFPILCEPTVSAVAA